jgi:tetratricopeptide (TPR) repeat protein
MVCVRHPRGLSAGSDWDSGNTVRWRSIFPGVLAMALALPAYAQGSGNKAAAEALFVEGRNLMAAERYAEACPKFEASQEMDPGLGTMLNLAECYEKTGKTASAWAQYREAIPIARSAGSKEREELAAERAKALQDRLSTLTIRVTAKDAALDVRRDGVPVHGAQLGTPIPVDPGEHTVEATAEGKQPWSTKVDVGADAAKVEVEIPALQDAADGAGTATTGADVTLDSGTTTTSSGSGQRVLGIALGAAGVVGLGVGTFFGLSASSDWDDAKSNCDDFPYGCNQSALDARESANSNATLSTIGFIAGGALLATGAVLFFTASSGETKTAIGVGPGSAFVKGTF